MPLLGARRPGRLLSELRSRSVGGVKTLACAQSWTVRLAGFSAGALSVQQLAFLPTWPVVAALAALVSVGVCFKPLRAGCCIGFGFCWAAAQAHFALAHVLPPEFEGQLLVLDGYVTGLPQSTEHGVRFLLQPLSARRMTGQEWRRPGTVRLTWHTAHAHLIPGERWRFQARVKRPRGFMNPGGFDYEAWIYETGVRATGYVKGRTHAVRVAPSDREAVNRWRQTLRDELERGAEQRDFQGVITALVMGEQHGINAEQWRVFNGTGTSHLIAISGLHVGMLAGLGYVVGRYGWAFSGMTGILPAPRVGAVAAIVAATAYSALAGFAIPTVRTLIMLSIALVGQIVDRQWRAWDILTAALAVILLMDPGAGILPGFWLSFGAVAVILFAMRGRIKGTGLWWKVGRVHWVIALGLTPMLLYWFGQNPAVGPLANLVAVPWVSMGIVPLALAGALAIFVWPWAGQWLLQAADSGLGWLWLYLRGLNALDFAVWTQPMPPLWLAVAATLGAFLLLLPAGLPGRALGGVWLLPLVLYKPPGPAASQFRMTVLDVGQGLAVVIETARHTLVYDVGARFSPNLDAGAAVVATYLRQMGRNRVDLVVLSNSKRDHSGGWSGFSQAIRVDRTISAVPSRVAASGATHCAGRRWEWDGIEFEILTDDEKATSQGLAHRAPNDSLQCVLRVATHGHAALVLSDLRSADEARLVHRYGAKLRANVLVVPNHGSRASSSASLLQAVGPEYAFVSCGYGNAYGYPHPEVLERYRQARAAVAVTSITGAVSILVGATIEPPKAYRHDERRFWTAGAMVGVARG